MSDDRAEMSKADLLVWLDKLFVPPLKQLLHMQITKAVQQAEAPLRARIAELERELARTREAVAKAVEVA